jgi:hypothetical protein
LIIAGALAMALVASGYIVLQLSSVQTYIIRQITENLSRKTGAKISIEKVDFRFFNLLVLQNVLVEGTENDTIFYTNLVSAEIDSLSFRKRNIVLSELNFNYNQINISRDTLNRFNFGFILDSLQTEKADTTTGFWRIRCNHFGFHDSKMGFTNFGSSETKYLLINDLNLSVSGFENFADSTVFNLDNLNLNYNNQVKITSLAAKIAVGPKSIRLSEMNMQSDKSAVNNLNLYLKTYENEVFLDMNSDFELSLEPSNINLSELAELIPALKGMDEDIGISGNIYGTIHDLKGKDLTLLTGEKTVAVLDFYVNGIENPETMYLFLDLKKLETTVADISDFTILKNGRPVKYTFPYFLYQSGLFSYQGNFSGFLSDFVSFGTLTSKMGTIKTDVSVIPKDDGQIAYKGKISTTDFNIGSLFKIDDLGRLTFNGEANGDYRIKSQKISGLFKGEITKIEAHGYEYKNIHLDGYYKDKMFDGMVNMNDSNLQFTFKGKADVSKEMPEFDFNVQLDKALPANLNLIHNFPKSELAFNMRARFSGNKLDNLKGIILVNDGYFKNQNGVLGLNGIQLISIPKQSAMELAFNSDYFDVRIEGNYQFQDLVYSIKKSLNKFVPTLKLETPPDFRANIFDYKINVKNLDDITHVFVPGLTVETPFFLYGKIDSNQSNFELEGSVPGFSYRNIWFRNIFVSNKAINNEYVSKIKIKEITRKNSNVIYNFSVNSSISENVLKNKIEWFANRDSSGYSSFISNSDFTTESPTGKLQVSSEFSETELFIGEKYWQLTPFEMKFDSADIAISNFKLKNEKQFIEIDGLLSKDTSKILAVNFNQIDLEKLTKGVTNKKIKGILNCSLNISDVFEQPVVIADANINDLNYANQLIGDVVLSSSWDKSNAEIDSRLEIVKNKKRSLSVKGTYNPATNNVFYNLKADSLPLNLLETVIANDLFNSISGAVSGNVVVSGKASKILMDGAVKVSDGALTIDYTKTKYFVQDSVYFNTDTILFRNVSFTDVQKNRGKMNGILVHDNFANMLYDFSFSSPKIKVLNTTMSNNDVFYGDVFANCQMRLFGKGPVVKLTGSLTSLPGTAVNISMEYQSVIEKYDFIQFIDTQKKEDENANYYNPSKTDFTISLNMEVTPDAKIQLVYNSQIGDIIKGEGEGIMLFDMNKYGDISLSGDFTVTKGDYLFTLQSVLNKRFIIAPGGTIVWSGDPYNAVIDLKAIYQLKTSLSDLKADANYLYQRIPVECVILLTNELINPTINFEINFPDESESFKTEYQQYFNTEEELNKQILSLIIMGKFYTPEYMRGQYESNNTSMIGSTASELFSNQLSNWLSQISDNVDIGFKYRPGNSITNDELELALSTQIFNDRVSLNGNIGNNVNPESSTSSQVVGDVDVRVKLTPNGKIQLKAYNHSNNDLVYETAPYTQGVGLSFKEEYNSFNELLRKMTAIFRKKKN